MELVLIVAGLCALGVLATRFGVDSRDSLCSREQELASRGWRWDEQVEVQRWVPEQPVSHERSREALAEAV